MAGIESVSFGLSLSLSLSLLSLSHLLALSLVFFIYLSVSLYPLFRLISTEPNVVIAFLQFIAFAGGKGFGDGLFEEITFLGREAFNQCCQGQKLPALFIRGPCKRLLM